MNTDQTQRSVNIVTIVLVVACLIAIAVIITSCGKSGRPGPVPVRSCTCPVIMRDTVTVQ